MTIAKEIAKFISCAEAFHAIAHTYFWLSDTTMTMFEITLSPTGSMGAAAVNAIISLILSIYAWKSYGRRGYTS
jgi:hypothetical protein